MGLGTARWPCARRELQMSLKADSRDNYDWERVPQGPQPNGQGGCEEWRPKGVSAFWVAEIGDEVVGSVTLGGSFVHSLPFGRGWPSMSEN
jgi:hypothetical protein